MNITGLWKASDDSLVAITQKSFKETRSQMIYEVVINGSPGDRFYRDPGTLEFLTPVMPKTGRPDILTVSCMYGGSTLILRYEKAVDVCEYWHGSDLGVV